MINSERIAKTVDTMNTRHEKVMAQRILHALNHPDNPLDIIEFDAQRLARHIALRLTRKARV